MKRVAYDEKNATVVVVVAVLKHSLKTIQCQWHQQTHVPKRYSTLAGQLGGMVWWLQSHSKQSLPAAALTKRLETWKKQVMDQCDALVGDAQAFYDALLHLRRDQLASAAVDATSNHEVMNALDPLKQKIRNALVEAALWRRKTRQLHRFAHSQVLTRMDWLLAQVPGRPTSSPVAQDWTDGTKLPLWTPYYRVNHRHGGVEIVVSLRGVLRRNVEVSWKACGKSQCNSPTSLTRQSTPLSAALQITGIKFPSKPEDTSTSDEAAPRSFGRFSIEIPVDKGNGHQAKPQWLANGTLVVYVPFEKQVATKRRLRGARSSGRQRRSIHPTKASRVSRGSPLSSVPEDSETQEDVSSPLFPTHPARKLSFKEKVTHVWTSYFNGWL